MADAPDKPVYLLTGSDRPKIETALGRLRRHFVAEAIDVSSALDTPGAEAVALCNATSLFGSARLVVIDDVDGARDTDGRRKGGWKATDVEAVRAYLANPAPDTVLALVGEDVKKTTALWKACAKAGQILEFAVAKKGVQSWVAEQFRQRGVSAEPEAAALLVQLVGDDLRSLASEVDKVATWAAGEPVGEREIEMLVATTADAPTYVLTDAWAGRDTARALAASETIFERESRARRDTAARLAGALGGHLGRLRTMKRLAAEGVTSKQAAEKLKLHPFFAQKLYAQAESFSAEDLDDALVRLAELDGSLKGQSRLAPDLEVQRTLVAVTQRPGAVRAGAVLERGGRPPRVHD
ncbi:MAG TPA: DNA polymerase III subunit delta [Gaiellaceae bacterium]|nr:DNA polymerase III subunit delta [Gaiellaceae bacterium]